MFYVCLMTGLPGRVAGSNWLFGPTVPWYAYATFTQNLRYATGGPNLAMWISATWSLAVEEQFYLVLPAVILLVPKPKLPYVVGGGILAAPLLRVLLDLKYRHGLDASFNLMPCRADALLLGVTCALLVRHQSSWELLKSHRRWLASVWIMLLAGLPLFILFKQTESGRSILMSTMGFSWLALFYAGLLLLALIYSGSWLGRILRNSWLKALGTISYCVYLIHYPILGLIFAIFRGKQPWAENSAERGLVLLALALTIAVASFSWTILEKPLLKIGHSMKY
jgi:peptidoglycan/LPS O-acetylase OafA/YrhL